MVSRCAIHLLMCVASMQLRHTSHCWKTPSSCPKKKIQKETTGSELHAHRTMSCFLMGENFESNFAPKIIVCSQSSMLRGLLTLIYELEQILIQILIDLDIEMFECVWMFEGAKSTLSQLKLAEKPKKSKIEWISERTRSKSSNIWPFWKSCCGFPVLATLKVDIDSEHSVHKVVF